MILCAASLLCLPPSPRWLTLHGRHAEAEAAWDKLGVGRAEREKVELESGAQEAAAPTEKPKESIRHKLFDIFSKDVRSRTALVVFMMGMQQLSGIDGVLYVCHTRIITSISLLSALTSIAVRASVVPAGRTRLLGIKFLRIRHFSTRYFLRDDSRIDLRRQMGPPRQRRLRRHRAGNCHVPHRRIIRGQCRARVLWSWTLGRHCLHLRLYCRFLHDMGRQHQNLCARDPSESDPRVGNHSRPFC